MNYRERYLQYCPQRTREENYFESYISQIWSEKKFCNYNYPFELVS